MKKTEEGFELRFRPRAMETVPLEIPKDVLGSLEKVAAIRDMSYQALLKFYIGQGLRQDLSRLFADHVLDKAAEVLAKHLQSEEDVLKIMREIRAARTQASDELNLAV
jgi:hypothetical protein